ncbi:MAG: porin family protein [Gemmatimonadetes bacterium]|nr:porin family protein [Gemmatimonadota bacterium]
MSYFSTVGVGLVALVVAANPLVAQRSIFVFGHGGGFSSLEDLNAAGTADFDTGFNVGGGVGLQLNKYLAVRGSFDFAKSDVRGFGVGGLEGAEIKRFFYGADLQLRYPFSMGLSPYVFGGAGGVTIDDTGGRRLDSFSKFAGRFGAGLSYEFPGSGFGIFGEASGFVYDFDRAGVDETQVDIAWHGGLAYRFDP